MTCSALGRCPWSGASKTNRQNAMQPPNFVVGFLTYGSHQLDRDCGNSAAYSPGCASSGRFVVPKGLTYQNLSLRMSFPNSCSRFISVTVLSSRSCCMFSWSPLVQSHRRHVKQTSGPTASLVVLLVVKVIRHLWVPTRKAIILIFCLSKRSRRCCCCASGDSEPAVERNESSSTSRA